MDGGLSVGQEGWHAGNCLGDLQQTVAANRKEAKEPIKRHFAPFHFGFRFIGQVSPPFGR